MKLFRTSLVGSYPERTIVAPDCGMKYLPRDVAFGKLQAMVKGADIVRAEVNHELVLSVGP